MEPSTSKSYRKLRPGKLYIFNHKFFDFDELSVRDGTECDVQALQNTFKIFDVETIIYNDLKYEELYGKITEISTINFSNHSCIIIAILTHGCKNNLLAARDKMYHFNDILLKISTNIYLISKPKIFLLQACRGDIDSRLNKRVQQFKTDGHAISIEIMPYCDEKYVLYSATDEFVSYREMQIGSPFIQIFCLYLNKLGFHRPISEIFPLVMIEVQKLTKSSQMPEITTNATKPYIFGDYRQGCISPISEEKTDEQAKKKIVTTNESTESDESESEDMAPILKKILDMLETDDSRKFFYVFDDYIQAVSGEPQTAGTPLGPKIMIKDESEESYDLASDNLDNSVIRQYYDNQNSDTLTEDTKNKNENEPISKTFRLKNVENEHSGLENVQLEKDQWVPFCEHHIPAIAVVGGTDLDKTLLYVGRAYYENELLPGKVFLNRSLIGIPYKGKEIGLREFEVLTGECYSWVKSDPPGTVPMNAVIGGWTESGETLYIGRAQHVGSLTPGKIKLSDNCLYIPFGNKEERILNYEVLVRLSQLPEIRTNATKSYFLEDYSQGAISSIPEGNTATEYSKNENELLSNTIRLKNVENEHSGLENVQLQKDQWVPFSNCHLPMKVVVGGTDLDKTLLYVGRAYYENELLPGKVFLNRSLIGIPYKGKEIGLREFEVLTGECYSWVKSDPPGTVPMNAVNGGWTESGETLYIGRAQHFGSLTPGKIKLSENCLYIPFGGKELKLLEYEVLVRSS